jgi:hypothetical protein
MGTRSAIQRSGDDAGDRQIAAMVRGVARAHTAEFRAAAGLDDEPADHSANSSEPARLDALNLGALETGICDQHAARVVPRTDKLAVRAVAS